jgi:hypothetical protein
VVQDSVIYDTDFLRPPCYNTRMLEVGTIIKGNKPFNADKVGILVEVQYDNDKCVKQILIHWYDNEQPSGYKLWEFYNYFAKVA